MASTLLRWHHHANVGYAACAFAVPYILMPHHLCHKQKTLFDLHESKAFVAFAGIQFPYGCHSAQQVQSCAFAETDMYAAGAIPILSITSSIHEPKSRTFSASQLCI